MTTSERHIIEESDYISTLMDSIDGPLRPEDMDRIERLTKLLEQINERAHSKCAHHWILGRNLTFRYTFSYPHLHAWAASVGRSVQGMRVLSSRLAPQIRRRIFQIPSRAQPVAYW